MKRNITWEQLARYFAGELHGEERQKMESWITSDPERKKQVDQLHEIWRESEYPPYPLDVDKAWNTLSVNMDRMDDGLKEKGAAVTDKPTQKNLYKWHQPGKRTGGIQRRIILVAATVLIVFGAALFSVYSGQAGSEVMMAEKKHHMLETQHGERATYQLSDGSRVILHAGSRLEIPDDYNAENRELFLDGEAYFETAHDPEKPFIVHSGDTYTEVLGTRFLVQAWPDLERNVEVVVSEGKVMFGDNRPGVEGAKKVTMVTQNQRAVLTGVEGIVVSEIIDIDWYFGWTEGRLVFENRPLSEVLPRLERWYDITLEVEEESLKAETITAEIDYSLPMSDVLMGLAMSLELELDKEGRRITFRRI
jgi:transmembrane sensor